jgi:hypothetical protein
MRALLLLLLLFSLYAPSASAAIPGPMPSGTWTAMADLRVQYVSPNMVLIIRNATYVVAEGGVDYSYYGTYSISTSPNNDYLVKFRGAAVCTGGDAEKLMLTYDEPTCSAPAGVSWFCTAGATYYTGAFDFGVSSSGSTLMIDGDSGAQSPLLFRCVSDSCSSQTSCNASIVVNTITQVYGGTVNATSSTIITNNSTNYFEGDEITLADNNGNVTIVQSNTMNETTVLIYILIFVCVLRCLVWLGELTKSIVNR